MAETARDYGRLETLKVRRRDSTIVVTLDRPHVRNAINRRMIVELSEVLSSVRQDPEINTMVLSGSGERAFCSGMDLKEFSDSQTVGSAPDYDLFMRGQFPKPVIAAVNGVALAGGFELVLACDIVIASSQAAFGLPEVKRGLIAGAGGVLLSYRIPMAMALEIGLTGEPINARRAEMVGIVNRVVPSEDVISVALAMAEGIARNAPAAMAETKRVMRSAGEGRFTWDEMIALGTRMAGHPDAREGALAFVHKREPHWGSGAVMEGTRERDE